MTNLVSINGKQLQIKEFKSQRVITFKDVDTVHERTDGTAKRNFNTNKLRFIENVDYFFVKPSDVEGYEIRTSEINNAGTYLITESGYLMLVKSLTDDLAWQVQRELVNNYFRAKALTDSLSELSPQLQLLISMELKQKELEQKTQVLEHRVNNLDTTNIDGTPRQRLNAMVKKYAYDNGILYKQAWKDFRRHFNTAYRTNIELKKSNYMESNGIKNLSYPAYMERVGVIEDALRVADKMLNKGV